MANGFFALFDDIAALMDDVAVMTKVAGKKTAAVLGDDLAVNAQKASGFASSRELPVIWAITKGSFFNKLIVLPLVFLLDWLYAPLVEWLLFVGGLYLAYEGVEKFIEIFFHHNQEKKISLQLSKEEILAQEKSKIRSAIVTDLILSLEIVIIAINSVESENFFVKVTTVSIIAFLATIGVYGLVALIVRLDDMGIALIERGWKKLGGALIWLMPKVIKALGWIGMVAMLLVGGGIFVHQFHQIEEFLHFLPPLLIEAIVGVVIGFVVMGVVTVAKKIKFS